MNKMVPVLGLVFVLGGGSLLTASSSYNRLVPYEESVNASYAEYQNQLKRQADLIPNFAEVVKSYMSHEQKTLVDTAAARAGEVSKFKPSDVANNPELQKKLVDAQASTGKALATLNMIKEAYPQLKADGQTSKLLAELSGTQNRITVARYRNQETVRTYNLEVRQFPSIIVAKIIGFHAKPYFEASVEEQNAPRLNMKVGG